MWDLPHHRYRDTLVTVGAMAGAACVEWHLHAWDLARALGKDYRPAAPEIVLAGGRTGAPQRPPGPASAPATPGWSCWRLGTVTRPGRPGQPAMMS